MYELKGPTTINSASYDGVSFYVGSQDITSTGLVFNSNGSKMYMVGITSDSIYQYSVASAWLLDSASYDGISFYVGSQDSTPVGLAVSSDESKMYVIGTNSDSIYQYSVASAGLLDSASYDGVSFYIGSQDYNPVGLAFSNDGSKMYSLGYTNKRIYQYSVASAWLLDSASYDGISFYVGSQDSAPIGLTFNDNGCNLYLLGSGNDRVYQYSVASAWLVNSASYDGISFYVGSQDSTPRGLAFNSYDSKMYMIGTNSDSIYQYSVAKVVQIYPEYDYADKSSKIEDRHTTRDASEFIYKWADKKQVSFSLMYVTSSDKYTINEFFTNNTDLTFRNLDDPTDIFSCHIINTSLPIGQFVKPYTNLFKGKIELGSY